jgi:hypothetical protein
MVSQDRGVYKKQPTNGESLYSIGWLTVVLANVGGVVKPASGAEYSSFDETLPLIG